MSYINPPTIILMNGRGICILVSIGTYDTSTAGDTVHVQYLNGTKIEKAFNSLVPFLF